MIELPEAETIRRDLDKEISGKRVKEAEVLIARAVGGTNQKKAVVAALEKGKVTAVGRRGLVLLIRLDTDEVVVIDLGEAGQLRRHANKDEVNRRTAVVITFTQGGQLRLVDNGTDASLAVVPAAELDHRFPDLAGLGIDPIEEPMSWTTFGRMLLGHKMKLKSLLTDDTIIAGLGELYADEILFEAGLRFDRMSDSLSTQEIRRLYRALVEILHDAVKYRGSTVDGSNYLDVFGEPGSYQEHHQVYRRDGQLSPRSRRPIQKTKFNGSWTYFCEQSQV